MKPRPTIDQRRRRVLARLRALPEADLAPPRIATPPAELAEIEQRHGVSLARELYREETRLPVAPRKARTKRPLGTVEVIAPVEELAIEAAVGELRLKPASPALRAAVRHLAAKRDAARLLAGWLAGLLKRWPANPAELAAFDNARRAKIVADAKGFSQADHGNLRTLFDALLDRPRLRNALLVIARRAQQEVGWRGTDRARKALARVLSFAAVESFSADLRALVRRHRQLPAPELRKLARREFRAHFPPWKNNYEARASAEVMLARALPTPRGGRSTRYKRWPRMGILYDWEVFRIESAQRHRDYLRWVNERHDERMREGPDFALSSLRFRKKAGPKRALKKRTRGTHQMDSIPAPLPFAQKLKLPSGQERHVAVRGNQQKQTGPGAAARNKRPNARRPGG